MKTYFFCEEINYRNLRFDTRSYSLNQYLVLEKEGEKYGVRVTSIKYNSDGSREIWLALEKDHTKKRYNRRLPLEVNVPAPSWIEGLIKDIEGKAGRVYWRRRKKRRF